MKIPRKGTDTRKIVSKDEKKSDSSSTFQVLSSELRRNTTLAPSENNTDDTFLVPKFASKFPNDSSAVPFIVPDVPVAQTNSKSSSPLSQYPQHIKFHITNFFHFEKHCT